MRPIEGVEGSQWHGDSPAPRQPPAPHASYVLHSANLIPPPSQASSSRSSSSFLLPSSLENPCLRHDSKWSKVLGILTRALCMGYLRMCCSPTPSDDALPSDIYTFHCPLCKHPPSHHLVIRSVVG